jgi:peptidoglycan/xylan/chitin deacetylase (PgdA/CDA1 family)
VISFDDGWQDNYEHAFPLLKKYQLPACIFLATDYISSREQFWSDRVLQLLTCIYDQEAEPLCKMSSPRLRDSGICDILENTKMSHGQKIDAVIERLKGYRVEYIQDIIEELESLIEGQDENIKIQSQMLTWNQIREMKKYGIDFGSHSKSHAILTTLTAEEVGREMMESKHAIEKQLNKSIEGFCFPNGNYNKAIMNMLISHGYKYACTTDRGQVKKGDCPLALKRIGIHNDVSYSTALFACRILGVPGF